jgi:hypothetical protein
MGLTILESWKKINTREGKDMNTTEDVYERMMNGGEIQKQIERIGGMSGLR